MFIQNVCFQIIDDRLTIALWARVLLLVLAPIVNMHDRISEAVYNNEYSAGIILSLAKAVDTLDPKIILYDLEYYVICSIQVNWFKTYLNNHAQRVICNGVWSDISCGVPLRDPS